MDMLIKRCIQKQKEMQLPGTNLLIKRKEKFERRKSSIFVGDKAKQVGYNELK